MPTILVVEDDPIARNIMLQVLTKQGFRVFEADSAEEAAAVCDAMRSQPLDLLIADHALPGSAGRELFERIQESCPNVKILQLSGWPYSRMEQENALLPGSSFLQKPFTGGQLLSLVQNILDPRTQ
ncbi:MAG TPA: response regulator [Bryobacteraceae bacterium]